MHTMRSASPFIMVQAIVELVTNSRAGSCPCNGPGYSRIGNKQCRIPLGCWSEFMLYQLLVQFGYGGDKSDIQSGFGFRPIHMQPDPLPSLPIFLIGPARTSNSGSMTTQTELRLFKSKSKSTGLYSKPTQVRPTSNSLTDLQLHASSIQAICTATISLKNRSNEPRLGQPYKEKLKWATCTVKNGR